MGKKNCINKRSLIWVVFPSILILIIIIFVVSFYNGKKALGQGYYFNNAHEISNTYEVTFSYTEFTNYGPCDLKFKSGKSLDYGGTTVIITRVRFNDDIIIIEGIPHDYCLFKIKNKSYYWIIQKDGEEILGPLTQNDFENLDLTNVSVNKTFILEDFTINRDDFYTKFIRFLYD